MPSSKPGDFTAYLEYMKRSREEPNQPPSPVTPITLLEILARQPQREMAMVDLEKLSEMDPPRFRNALRSLIDPGYVELSGTTLEAVVKLTDKGADAARLARPT